MSEIWNDYIQDVKLNGFDEAAPLARLIWSCEVGHIDQHASKELMKIAAELSELAELKDYYARVISEPCPPDEQHCTCVPALRAELDALTAALDAIEKAGSNAKDYERFGRKVFEILG